MRSWPMSHHKASDDTAKARKILQEDSKYLDEAVLDEAITNVETWL
jgi:hypothetical protein